MSKFDENLFGRIAVLGDHVTREQLEECLEVSRRAGGRPHVGQVLLEKGYISREQYERVLELRRQKLRRLLRDPDEAREMDRELVSLMLREGLSDIDAVEDAVLEQERLRGLNLHFALAEVLVSRGALRPGDALSLLSRQGRRLLGCPACDVYYRVLRYEDGRRYECRKCRGSLVALRFLDTLTAEAILDAESEVRDAEAGIVGVPCGPDGEQAAHESTEE